MTEAPVSSEAGSEQRQLDPIMFKFLVERADGKLLPLTKPATNGKKIFIAATRIANPFVEQSPRADPHFWLWEKDWDGKFHDGVVLVDVYAQGGNGDVDSIGHMDWWLSGSYANGGGNMHQALRPQQPHEMAANEKWGRMQDHIAFSVDPDYQKQDFGTLMLATSGVVLPAIGVDRFYSGGLLEPAKKTYARFGLTNFPIETQEASIPIERLSDSPKVDEVIEGFLKT